MTALLDGLAASFCQAFLSFLLICLLHDCFAGWLGRIILPRFSSISLHLSPKWLLCWMPWPDHFAWVCFHFFAFVTHMIALLDGLAGSLCIGSATPLLCCLPDDWLLVPWQHHFAICGLATFFVCLPDVCLRDDCSAGRLGRIIFQCVCFWTYSFHLSLKSLLGCMPCPDHFPMCRL